MASTPPPPAAPLVRASTGIPPVVDEPRAAAGGVVVHVDVREPLELKLVDPRADPPPGESDEFWTPRPRWQAWHQRFHFTVDVAAQRENALLPFYFTPEDDGLKRSWAGQRVWCNPPYSDIPPWIEKAWVEIGNGAAELAVHLLPANRMEQPWWQEWIEPFRDGRGRRTDPVIETEFLPKRFRFGFRGDPTGETGHQPRFGCVLVIWTPPICLARYRGAA